MSEEEAAIRVENEMEKLREERVSWKFGQLYKTGGGGRDSTLQCTVLNVH